MTKEEIAQQAETIRAAGVPDCLNRWLTITPEEVATAAERRTRKTEPLSRRIVATTTTPTATAAAEPAKEYDMKEAIANATGYITTLFLGSGQYDKIPSKTMEEAVGNKAKLLAAHPDTSRKPMIYATMPNGPDVLVTEPSPKSQSSTPRTPKGHAVKTSGGKTAPAAKKAPAKSPIAAKGPSKTDIAVKMLQRAKGTTRTEIVEATNWPSIDLRALAKRKGVKLSEKDGVLRFL